MKNKETIESKISKIHGGAFTRLAYKSEMPLYAEYKNKGCSIVKVTEKTCRVGVDYSHIGSVIAKRAINGGTTRETTNNYEWIVPNRIAYNKNTDKKYVAIANAKIPNTKTKYIITDEMMNVRTVDKLSEAEKAMVRASYAPKEIPEVQKICLDNIISINHSGREVFA